MKKLIDLNLKMTENELISFLRSKLEKELFKEPILDGLDNTDELSSLGYGMRIRNIDENSGTYFIERSAVDNKGELSSSLNIHVGILEIYSIHPELIKVRLDVNDFNIGNPDGPDFFEDNLILERVFFQVIDLCGFRDLANNADVHNEETPIVNELVKFDDYVTMNYGKPTLDCLNLYFTGFLDGKYKGKQTVEKILIYSSLHGGPRYRSEWYKLLTDLRDHGFADKIPPRKRKKQENKRT